VAPRPLGGVAGAPGAHGCTRRQSPLRAAQPVCNSSSTTMFLLIMLLWLLESLVLKHCMTARIHSRDYTSMMHFVFNAICWRNQRRMCLHFPVASFIVSNSYLPRRVFVFIPLCVHAHNVWQVCGVTGQARQDPARHQGCPGGAGQSAEGLGERCEVARYQEGQGESLRKEERAKLRAW